MLILISVLFVFAAFVLGFALANYRASQIRKQGLEMLKRAVKSDSEGDVLKGSEYAGIAELVEELIKDEALKYETRPESEPEEDSHLKEQLNNTLIINELGQKVTSSLKLKDTFDHLYHTLNSMMDASVLELAVFDADMERWHVLSNKEEESFGDYDNHVADWVLRNDRTVFLNDVPLDYGRFVDRPLELKSGEAVESLMSFPISIDGEVRGTISVMSLRKNAYEEYHKDSIEHLLNFLAVAIQNAFTHEQLNLLKIRAEESEKHEQQFLANMSHEIRTPMNAVLGMTNLLLDTALNERQLKYLKAIKTSSKNLLVIINDILDLSKLEAGKMEIENIPFRIREVIENVSETNRFKAEEKGLKFEVFISPEVPDVVKGDPTRLNQVLTNLCSNAIKFTEYGRVNISVAPSKDGKFVSFRVSDTGIGIPEDKLHLLFSNFKQIDSSTFRKYGGTGLGLSISKTLIELQGGKVDVKSEVRKGSTFSVHIPYKSGAEEDVRSMQGAVQSDYNSLVGVRILIAEDNEYNQIVVNDTLESLIPGVQLTIAENGVIALEKLSSDDFDIILMDAQMPEMDGLEATRRIRRLKEPEKATIPIIALTASVHKADIDKCIKAGMNDFVPKPFTRDELLNALVKYYTCENSSKYLNTPDRTEEEEPTGAEEQIHSPQRYNGRVTNLNFLRDFAEGDEARMRKYIGIYLKLLPKNMQRIEQAKSEANHELLVKVLHSMRPHLNYMGMKESAELAASIENAVREDRNQEFVPEAAETILTHCQKSQSELNDWLG